MLQLSLLQDSSHPMLGTQACDKHPVGTCTLSALIRVHVHVSAHVHVNPDVTITRHKVSTWIETKGEKLEVRVPYHSTSQ